MLNNLITKWKLLNTKNNLKKQWVMINKILNCNKNHKNTMIRKICENSTQDNVTNNYKFYNSLNQFLTKVGVNIDAKMPLSSKSNFLTAIKCIKKWFYLEFITPDKLLKEI